MPSLHGNIFSAKSVTETVINAPANAWVALPTTAMSGRALVEVVNKGEHALYLSFDNSAVIPHRAGIKTGMIRIFPIQDNVILYGRSGGAGSVRVIVTEYK